jgi:hypothetical protein
MTPFAVINVAVYNNESHCALIARYGDWRGFVLLSGDMLPQE